MMVRLTLAALLLTLVATASAFTMQPALRTIAPRTGLNLMAPEEVAALMNKASDCAEGECSLDEVGDLIDVLKGQQKELYDRVEKVKGMIRSLDAVNTQKNRKVDEVRETVRAIFRIFQLGDKASGNSKPTGWSGDVGDGPTTAYDALPPKPYKKSSK